MFLKLIKLARLIPEISEYLYKIAGVKDEAIKRFPQFEEQINELSNRGIEDSFLFSAIKLLNSHNAPKQKSEIDREKENEK